MNTDIVTYSGQTPSADIQMYPRGIAPVTPGRFTLDGVPVDLADIATVKTQPVDVALTKDRYVLTTPSDHQWSRTPAYRGNWPDSIQQAVKMPFLAPERRRAMDDAAYWLDTVTDRPRGRTLETIDGMVGAFFEQSQVYNILSDNNAVLVPGNSRAARELASDMVTYTQTALPLWEMPFVVWAIPGYESADVVWAPGALLTESRNVAPFDPQLLRMAGLEAPPAPREIQQATRLIPNPMEAGQVSQRQQPVTYRDHVARPRPRDPVIFNPTGMRRGEAWRTATLEHIALNQKLTDAGIPLLMLAHPETPIRLAKGDKGLRESLRNAPRTIALLADEALVILRKTANLSQEPSRRGQELQFPWSEQIVAGLLLGEFHRASLEAASRLTGTPVPVLSRAS